MKTEELVMMEQAYNTVKRCRVCGSGRLTMFWDGGEMSIVEFPKIGTPPEKPKAPLSLVVCEDCWLVQLRHTVNPRYLYSEFWYRSNTNEMMRKELRQIALSTLGEQEIDLYRDLWILDIGSNDGTLLQAYPYGHLIHLVGMDPAQNITHVRIENEVCFVADYFGAEKALEASNGNYYDIVTSIAMFYDLDDPVDFVKQVNNVLAPNGVFVVQMNYLPTMLRSCGVDNICHEHLTYFSLSTLIPVFRRAGLEIYKAELNATNGGSLRVFAGHIGAHELDNSVTRLIHQEHRQGLDSLHPYRIFGTNVRRTCDTLDRWLTNFVHNDRKVYAYGASTRGTTLLQLLNTKGKIIACAERAPEKVGRYMVGAVLPIISEEEAREKADVFFVLPWHFIDAIEEREAKWIDEGGVLVVPLPEPQMIKREL